MKLFYLFCIVFFQAFLSFSQTESPSTEKNRKNGHIVFEKEDEQYGALFLTLNNGAKIVIKKTDNPKNKTEFLAYSRKGISFNKERDFYNFKFEDLIIQNTVINNFIDKVNTSAVLKYNLKNGGVWFQGGCYDDGLKDLIKMIYSSFISKSCKSQDFDFCKYHIIRQLKERCGYEGLVFEDSVFLTRYPKTKHFVQEDTKKIKKKKLFKNYTKRVTPTGDFTFYFCGNFEIDTLKKYICQYIGALPEKKSNGGSPKNKLEFNNKTFDKTFHIQCEENIFQTDYISKSLKYNLENKIKTQALQNYINKRLKTFNADTIKCNINFLHSQKELLSEITLSIIAYKRNGCNNQLNKEINSIIQDISQNGFNKEDLENIKTSLIKEHRQDILKNSYWISVMHEKYNFNCDADSYYEKITEELTGEELQKFFNYFLSKAVKHTYSAQPLKVVSTN